MTNELANKCVLMWQIIDYTAVIKRRKKQKPRKKVTYIEHGCGKASLTWDFFPSVTETKHNYITKATVFTP